MQRPPRTLDGADVLLWVTRSEAIYFIPEGDTQHPVRAMAICRYTRPSKTAGGMYLFKCDGDWNVIQDSPCNSIRQGMASATQWGIQQHEWKCISPSGEEVTWLEGISVLDKAKFESRGPVGCSNSDYRLKRTTCCGSYGAEDEELLEFYIEPAELSRRIDLVLGCTCPFCGAKEWGLTEIKSPADVPQEWRWACRS